MDNDIFFDNVSLTFNGRSVLSNIHLHLREQRIALIGANGSGKSSFLRLINGLIAPTTGRIFVNGLELPQKAAEVRRQTGFIFQNPDMQIIMPTVAEDIAFGLKNLRLPQAEIAARTKKIMAEYELTAFADEPTRSLSGGQKQILALCGVLVMQPVVILFDEPTNQLDLRHKNRFAGLIARLPQQIIMATHDLTLAETFDRILVLNKGQIIFDGPTAAAIAFHQKQMTEYP